MSLSRLDTFSFVANRVLDVSRHQFRRHGLFLVVRYGHRYPGTKMFGTTDGLNSGYRREWMKLNDF